MNGEEWKSPQIMRQFGQPTLASKFNRLNTEPEYDVNSMGMFRRLRPCSYNKY